jgi:hypothetical protein
VPSLRFDFVVELVKPLEDGCREVVDLQGTRNEFAMVRNYFIEKFAKP